MAEDAPQPVLTTRVVEDEGQVAVVAADAVAAVLAARPDALILAPTGSTPGGLYRELARRRAVGEIDTSRMRVAQLDEYLGVAPADRHSLFGWMERAILTPLGIDGGRTIRIDAASSDPQQACRDYDAAIQAAGGIDLAILGIGRNGHLGFNEPRPRRMPRPGSWS